MRIFSAIAVIGLATAACSPMQSRPVENPSFAQAYEVRANRLQSLDQWTLKGRLAINDGKDGGSGQLSWEYKHPVSQLSFRGAFGKGAWQLRSDDQEALLEMANGDVYTAATVSDLVFNHVGWKVPIEALSWWVKGLAHPGAWDSRELDEEGRLHKLQQLGWDVEFFGYHHPEASWLPTKLSARNDKYRVKMVVKEWSLETRSQALE